MIIEFSSILSIFNGDVILICSSLKQLIFLQALIYVTIKSVLFYGEKNLIALSKEEFGCNDWKGKTTN